MNKTQIDEYKKINKCPKCNGTDIRRIAPTCDPNEGTLRIKAGCEDCKCGWFEIYILSDITDIYEGIWGYD